MNRIIIKHYPDYERTITDFFYRDNRRICFNMFFTSREVCDRYCEWLFPLLFEIEKYVKLSNYKFQQRVFGFMSELMLPLFCLHNKLKIKYVPVCMIGTMTCKENKLKCLFWISGVISSFVCYVLEWKILIVMVVNVMLTCILNLIT